jgi:hypothetical protein
MRLVLLGGLKSQASPAFARFASCSFLFSLRSRYFSLLPHRADPLTSLEPLARDLSPRFLDQSIRFSRISLSGSKVEPQSQSGKKRWA